MFPVTTKRQSRQQETICWIVESFVVSLTSNVDELRFEQMEEVHRHLAKSGKAVGTTPPGRNIGLRARVTAFRRNNSRQDQVRMVLNS